MSNLPLSYRVVGQDDYMLEIDVDATGAFRVNSGDHTSHEPRDGVLSPIQMVQLMELIDCLGAAREHPAPDGATGFMAVLTLGAGETACQYRFWEGALDEEPDLAAVVRALEVI
jgi:hypothetical protein